MLTCDQSFSMVLLYLPQCFKSIVLQVTTELSEWFHFIEISHHFRRFPRSLNVEPVGSPFASLSERMTGRNTFFLHTLSYYWHCKRRTKNYSVVFPQQLCKLNLGVHCKSWQETVKSRTAIEVFWAPSVNFGYQFPLGSGYSKWAPRWTDVVFVFIRRLILLLCLQ